MTAKRTSSESPPAPPAEPRTILLHGRPWTDEYAWMRDDERRDPRVLAHLEAENRYTEEVLRPTEPLREALYGEMLGRIRQSDLSVPQRMGPYLYYTRTQEGKQYPVYARRAAEVEDAPEELLLDPNERAAGHAYYRLGGVEVSPDHTRLAFLADSSGAERFDLQVVEIATGRTLPDRVAGVQPGIAWSADGGTLFYMRTDAAQRPDRVFRHTVGESAEGDVQVFHEPDPLFRVTVRRTRDRRYVVVSAASFTTSESWLIPGDAPAEPPRVVEPRRAGVLYEVDHHGGRLLVRTNDGAPDFRLMEATPAEPGRGHWREAAPMPPGVLLEDVDVFRDHWVLYEREGGVRRIRVREAATGAEHRVEFPEPVYAVVPGGNPEFDTHLLRFTYTSLLAPPAVYDYDLRTRARELRKEEEVAGYDPARYATERVWAPSDDGTLVPVSLVYRAPHARDGGRPLVLYGYGSYGVSTEPVFSAERVSLLDRGVVYAIAHVRGGQELGRAWYEGGRMLRRRGSFDDFAAAARHLAAAGYADPARMAAWGRSAGGGLVGAVLNQHPGLFRAAIADVPFVDTVNTLLDAALPLTAAEWEQWGNPAVAEQFEYLVGYSPYDNVRPVEYPALLVTAGLHDPRVGYWEAAKWVARLRRAQRAEHPILLRTGLAAGHGGASGRYDALRETALRYAFLLREMGAG